MTVIGDAVHMVDTGKGSVLANDFGSGSSFRIADIVAVDIDTTLPALMDTKPGSAGKPLPGMPVVLVDVATGEVERAVVGEDEVRARADLDAVGRDL